MRFSKPSRWLGRAATGAAIALGVLLGSAPSSAEVAAVPAHIQVDLLAKLETYDRGFSDRAGAVARILLVVKGGSTKSAIAAEEMKLALSRTERIGGRPHQETVVIYEGADALTKKVRAERVAIVYFAPGLDDGEVPALRAALDGTNVLTLTAVTRHVPLGVALGFELESGKPRIVINLPQARKQGIEFPPVLLKLMRVHR